MTTILFLFLSILTLAIQLWLCFSKNRTWIKLLPSAVLILSAIAFAVISACTGGWDGIGWMFFFLLSVWLLLLTAFSWAIWAISGKILR